MSLSWAIWVPEGPGKNDQYGQGRWGRRYLTKEAEKWRNIIAAELGDQECIYGLVKVWVHHLSSGQGRDDVDHQLVAALDAVTAAGGWFDDKQVAAIEVLREVVPLADSGVLIIAEELDSWEDLLS